ncbi:16858_t:CDS:2 [Funneliformis mosseae]|uniref:16858_t:CDS:1 n=1 Tax=Funneliformis mosseae TaxID=27381 RepID=A0A9N9DZ50_FUNMO|nr:16858_t:CDS:2 [Funneliformis mosseae]
MPYRNPGKKTKKKNVRDQLKTRGILKDVNTNKKDLVKELEIALAKDTLAKISATIPAQLPDNDELTFVFDIFSSHTAESMLAQLKQNVKDSAIEEEEVPKLKTIHN